MSNAQLASVLKWMLLQFVIMGLDILGRTLRLITNHSPTLIFQTLLLYEKVLEVSCMQCCYYTHSWYL